MFPDGRSVVSCSLAKELVGSYYPYSGDYASESESEYEYEGEIKVWDVVTGECVATLKGHSKEVRCGVRYLWYFCVDVCSSWVNCVAVFPDGRRIVSGSDDKTLKVWDVATGKCVATLKGHSGKYGVRRAASTVPL